MIKEFDKANLTILRNDFDAAIKQVAQKHGVTIRLKTLRFDSVQATGKIEFIATGVSGSAATDPHAAQLAIYKADFTRYASVFGLKPEQYGATIKSGRDSFKLIGLKPKAPKRPVLAQSFTDGKIYILTEASIVPLQSQSHKEVTDFIFGKKTPTAEGMCSNENSHDAKFNPIGKCNRKATTSRTDGFGRSKRSNAYCDQCARLIDESRAEMEAEARMS